MQTANDNLEHDRRILKDNIENIDKSLEIALSENEDIILKNDNELKFINNKLTEAISNNQSLEAINIELTNTIRILESTNVNDNEDYQFRDM